ncbi:DUF2116 family Zn-ribbon domain-containing protein [Psychrobacillus sp. FJAT-51614]|uniref:DUF2116 family Zn-ribbon domain-containing protein n=1 Tax=Psychrobacillus mangrovi TaxID=3117745 RepID=A0ABU8F221_9BACI
MKNCPNCTELIKNESQFCSHCGLRFQTQKKKQTNLIIPIIFIVLLGAIFITHGQIKEKTGPYRTIVELDNILSQQDATAALILFESQLSGTPLSEPIMQDFLNYLYLETNWESTLKEWKKAALREKETYKPLKTYNGDVLFTLEKTGSILGIYPKYEVMVHPYSVQVKTNTEGTRVTLNDQTKSLTKVDDFQKVSSILPSESIQELTFKVETKYTNFSDSIDFSTMTQKPNIVQLELPLELVDISIYSNKLDAIVYVNGKSTSTSVRDIGLIGPLPTDGSISIQLELDGRKTENVEVYSGGEYQLMFEEEMEVASFYDDLFNPNKEDLELLYDSFIATSVNAINHRDFTLVEQYFHPLGNSGIELEEYIPYLETKGITEQLLESEVVSFEVQDDGLHLFTFESYIINYPDKPSIQKSFYTENLLVIDDNQWKFYELLKTTEL